MATYSFDLVTRWTLDADVREVAEIITDAERFTDWWPEVYLSARLTDAGDARGLGRTVEVVTRGWLPYRLRWTGRVVAADPPNAWEIEATGDIEGRGSWALAQRGARVEAVHEWRVRVEKPGLRRLSRLLAPVLAANHRWAMARGLEGLGREIARRRAARLAPAPRATLAEA